MRPIPIFLKDVQEPVVLTSLPSDNDTRTIAISARELVTVANQITHLEERLETLRERKKELETVILPALMTEAQTDRIGIPDSEVDIILSDFAHAAIPIGWPPDKRKAAFDHLIALGADDLIKAEVIVAFPREEVLIAERFVDAAKSWLIKHKSSTPPDTVRLNMSVHHATLTGWLKGYLNRADDERPTNRPLLNPETIGATIGYIVKIIKRSKSRGAKR